MHRIFLISPASCRGRRAEMVLREAAAFPLARALRADGGAELGEVFSFLSGLYFRGKLRYARAFARAPEGRGGVEVITTTRGLVPPETRVTVEVLREFAAGDVRADAPAFAAPLERSAERIRDALPAEAEVVLLGSIATDKYLEVLLRVFDGRLRFPESFIGRGDMSRGGLLLRAADAGRELAYVEARGAPRHGRRPPRLERRRAQPSREPEDSTLSRR